MSECDCWNWQNRCTLNWIVELYLRHVQAISNCSIFKDRHDLSLSSGVVYKFKCSCCNAAYIGKTIRHLHTRMSEHKNVSDRTGNVNNSVSEKTAIYKHSQTCCDVSYADFEVLARDNSDFLLQLKESLLINRDKPLINVQGKIKNLYLALFWSRYFYLVRIAVFCSLWCHRQGNFYWGSRARCSFVIKIEIFIVLLIFCCVF